MKQQGTSRLILPPTPRPSLLLPSRDTLTPHPQCIPHTPPWEQHQHLYPGPPPRALLAPLDAIGSALARGCQAQSVCRDPCCSPLLQKRVIYPCTGPHESKGRPLFLAGGKGDHVCMWKFRITVYP